MNVWSVGFRYIYLYERVSKIGSLRVNSQVLGLLPLYPTYGPHTLGVIETIPDRNRSHFRANAKYTDEFGISTSKLHEKGETVSNMHGEAQF